MEEFSREWFDESSKEWMKNKLKKRSVYTYTCEHTYQSGKRCGRKCFRQESMCQQHWALEKNALAKKVNEISMEYILITPALPDPTQSNET